MTRKKVKLAWIANDSARRASLKKRRLGLLKKVTELTTLCGTKACLIIYSPDENEPMVWPSHAEVQRQIGDFHRMPELERLKKMMNQETYLRDRISKAEEQLSKIQRRNKEVEMGHLMHQIEQGKELDELNIDELHGLTWFVEEKMKEVQKRIDFFQQVPFVPSVSQPHGDSPPQGPKDDLTAPIGSGAGAASKGDHWRSTAEALLWDQWFIDMISNNEFKSAVSSSSIRGDMGLPHHPFAGIAAEDPGLPFAGIAAEDPGLPFAGIAAEDPVLPRHSFGGSWSGVADMGLTQYRNFRGLNTDIGWPPLGFGPHGGANDMRLPHGSAGGKSFSFFGSDIGLGLHHFGHVGNSSAGSELGLPFGPFGEASSSGAGSDTEPPFDGKSVPNNASP